ncbi:twin-arginine translocation signal domain-containing protein [Paenibacillus hexagrammi]|uniref:Twin-arginine translocation signal domain-containing protein n=1 Tax=Paenibacillus hexagrammi TaxID=2908839 RepID=A0ABY3SQT3_9BACL|nr:twin-arginine translocation signal domain-containing protein [Paenibacillus sp. YPD9-1]UJF35915.1 twin-arginine translocation signal domain-containing protein [Paenibacillus sp. YPD9-1]
MPEPQTWTRRSFLRRLTVLAATVAAGSLTASYASFVEPRWYETTRLQLSFPNLPSAFHGTKILLLSDLHIGHHFELSHLKDLITKVRAKSRT